MYSNHRGFTLIEVLIYIGLLSVILSGVFVTAVYLIEYGDVRTRKIETLEDSQFVIEKIQSFQNFGFDVVEPAVGATSSKLILERGDERVSVYASTGAVLLQRNDGLPEALTRRGLFVHASSTLEFSFLEEGGVFVYLFMNGLLSTTHIWMYG